MSNNKQSSVELFAIALYEKGYLQGNGDEINDLLEQHKAIHKYEIVDAVKYGCSDWGCAKDAEHYYNETFNTEEK